VDMVLHFLLLLLVPLFSADAFNSTAAPRKPNIVLVLVDDQDMTLGGWTPMKQTEKLWSAQGATANNWFIHTPVCCPSRAELLSGRYAHNIRVEKPNGGGCMHMDVGKVNPNSFGRYMANAGYTMGWFGKHMNTCPHKPPPGWDCPTCRWFANGGGADKEPGGYLNATFNNFEGTNAVAAGEMYGGKPGVYKANTNGEFAGYTTSVIANKSIAWLHDVAKRDKPFFMALAPKAPHVASTPAPWYLKGTFIDDLQAPRDPAYNASHELLKDHHWLIAQQPIITEEQGREIDNIFRDRWRSLLSVDDAVVGVINALTEEGVLDNTFMFFTSDHGYNLGQHRLPSCKLNVYDHDIRIPMVIRGPGIAANTTFDWIGSNVDVGPTFLALAGVDPTQTSPVMDGKSFAHKLIDPSAPSVPQSTALSVRRELQVLEGMAEGTSWRDHHWVEYNSLGNVVRTEHLVDDPKSNTYRALRFHDSAYGNILYAEFTALKNWDYTNTTDLFIEMFDLDKDPHQLHNTASHYSPALKAKFHEMAVEQFSCSGSSCT